MNSPKLCYLLQTSLSTSERLRDIPSTSQQYYLVSNNYWSPAISLPRVGQVVESTLPSAISLPRVGEDVSRVISHYVVSLPAADGQMKSLLL